MFVLDALKQFVRNLVVSWADIQLTFC